MKTLLSSLLAGCLMLTASMLAVPQAQGQDCVAFVNVRVFDGEQVIPNGTVVIRDGVIAEVGQEVDVACVDLAIRYEDDQTLLPGFIDAHTHTPFRGFAATSLMFGVTTLLDMFTPAEVAAEFRTEQAEGRAHDRADVFSSGIAVTAPGGHGTQFGVEIPTLGPGDDVEAFVAERVAEGSDYIKIILDDGSAYGITFPTFEAPTVEAIIRAAHAHDRMAVVHVGRFVDARRVIEAGADGLVHVWSDELPEKDELAFVAEHGVFVVPTLAVMAGLGGREDAARFADDERVAPWLRPGEAERLSQFYPRRVGVDASFENALHSVARLAEVGVPILAGTDAPNPGTVHGVSIHHELELLVEAGLEPVEALRAATSVPADAFGLDDRGRIAPGMRADLIVVRGDPTTDVSATLDIVEVWKAGRRVDRDAFRERLGARIEPGTISSFDDGTLGTRFGSGWIETTDQSMGGASTVALEVVEGGAGGTSHALRITGEVATAGPFQWSGTVVFPGGDPITGVDLSTVEGIRLLARGEPATYGVMLFSPSLGFAPIVRPFEVTEDWAEISFTWEDFGSDGTGVTGLGVVAGDEPGAFTIYIDEVELW